LKIDAIDGAQVSVGVGSAGEWDWEVYLTMS
jgi:hypothetical protein